MQNFPGLGFGGSGCGIFVPHLIQNRACASTSAPQFGHCTRPFIVRIIPWYSSVRLKDAWTSAIRPAKASSGSFLWRDAPMARYRFWRTRSSSLTADCRRLRSMELFMRLLSSSRNGMAGYLTSPPLARMMKSKMISSNAAQKNASARIGTSCRLLPASSH